MAAASVFEGDEAVVFAEGTAGAEWFVGSLAFSAASARALRPTGAWSGPSEAGAFALEVAAGGGAAGVFERAQPATTAEASTRTQTLGELRTNLRDIVLQFLVRA